MADTAVYSGATGDSYNRNALAGPYWSSSQVGAVVFTDNGDVLVARTTDGGATWGAPTTIWSGTTMSHLAAWYDRETPGLGTTLLHIAWLSPDGTDTCRYCTFDVADATVGTVRTVDATITVSSTANLNRIAITRTRSGLVLVAFSTQTEHKCWKSADLFASAGTSRASPYETATEEDVVLMFPANTGDDNDACCLFHDRSVDDLTIKMFDDSANTWTEFGTPLDTSIPEEFPYIHMDGALRHSDGHLLVAAQKAPAASGGSIKTWDVTVASITVPVVTAKTNVVSTGWLYQVAMLIDQFTDAVYVVWNKGPTGDAVVYKVSTDGMATWGSEMPYSQGTIYHPLLLHVGRSVTSAGGRFQPCWFDSGSSDVSVNLVNDIGLGPVVAAGGLTPHGAVVGFMAPPTYTGGITPTGAFTGYTPSKADVGGGLTPAGTLALLDTLAAAIGGAIEPVGVHRGLGERTFAGSLAPAHEMGWVTYDKHAGAMTPAGSVDTVLDYLFTGAMTPAGALAQALTAALSGTIRPVGIFSILRPPLRVAARMRALVTDHDGTKRGHIL